MVPPGPSHPSYILRLPLSLSLLKLLAAFSITRSFGRYRASQPAAGAGPWSRSVAVAVGRSVDVGRLDLRGRMAAFPAQAQLGRGPPAASLAIYGRFLPAPVPHNPHLVLALSCPPSCRNFPESITRQAEHGHTNGVARLPPNCHCTALHCGMSCPRNRVKHFVCLTAMGSFIFTQPPAICQICIAIYRDRLKSMLQVA